MPLRPAERLQRAELAHALADRRERRAAPRAGTRRPRRRSRARSRGCARGSTASTSEPLIWSATCFELATCACGSAVWIAFCTSPTDELVRGADEHDVGEALLVRERLQLLQRQVDVGGLTAERRADEPDDRERRAVQVELRADLQRVLRGVRARDERFVAAGRREEAALRDLRLGDDAHVPGCVWSTPPIVYAVVLMFVCGGSSTCCSVCCGVVNCVRNRCRLAGRHFANAPRSPPPATAAAATAAAEPAATAAAAAVAATGSRSTAVCAAQLVEAGLHRRELRSRRPRQVARDLEGLAARLQLRDDLRDDALLMLGEQRQARRRPGRRRRSTRSALAAVCSNVSCVPGRKKS